MNHWQMSWLIYTTMALVSWWFPGWWRLRDRHRVRTWKGTVVYLQRMSDDTSTEVLAIMRLFFAVGWPLLAAVHYTWQVRVCWRWTRKRLNTRAPRA